MRMMKDNGWNRLVWTWINELACLSMEWSRTGFGHDAHYRERVRSNRCPSLGTAISSIFLTVWVISVKTARSPCVRCSQCRCVASDLHNKGESPQFGYQIVCSKFRKTPSISRASSWDCLICDFMPMLANIMEATVNHWQKGAIIWIETALQWPICWGWCEPNSLNSMTVLSRLLISWAMVCLIGMQRAERARRIWRHWVNRLSGLLAMNRIQVRRFIFLNIKLRPCRIQTNLHACNIERKTEPDSQPIQKIQVSAVRHFWEEWPARAFLRELVRKYRIRCIPKSHLRSQSLFRCQDPGSDQIGPDQHYPAICWKLCRIIVAMFADFGQWGPYWGENSCGRDIRFLQQLPWMSNNQCDLQNPVWFQVSHPARWRSNWDRPQRQSRGTAARRLIWEMKTGHWYLFIWNKVDEWRGRKIQDLINIGANDSPVNWAQKIDQSILCLWDWKNSKVNSQIETDYLVGWIETAIRNRTAAGDGQESSRKLFLKFQCLRDRIIEGLPRHEDRLWLRRNVTNCIFLAPVCRETFKIPAQTIERKRYSLRKVGTE